LTNLEVLLLAEDRDGWKKHSPLLPDLPTLANLNVSVR
jgi:hypothetical protein